MHLRLVSDSAHSAYGAVSVLWRPSEQAPAQVLGRLDNVALHVDAGLRDIMVPLSRDDIAYGSLEVRYDGQAEYEGVTFDAKTFGLEAGG